MLTFEKIMITIPIYNKSVTMISLAKHCEAAKISVHQRESSCFTSSVFIAPAWFITVRFIACASSFSTQAAEEMLRKAVGKVPTKWLIASKKTHCGSPLRKPQTG